MPANPMQKKARNSFLLGMIVSFIICALVGAGAYFLISRSNKQKEMEEGTLTYAYRLKNNIASGQEIKTSDVESVLVTSKVVPVGAFPSKRQLKDEKGKEKWVDVSFPIDYIAKVNLTKGTILADSLVAEKDYLEFYTKDAEGQNTLASDVRRVEYNMLSLETENNIGNFVDIRLRFPNGMDLVVVSRKEIKTLIGNTIGFDMTEAQIDLVSSAIVESYIMKGSKLYTTQYIEPGNQSAITPTYVPTDEVIQLIKNNPNIVESARKDLERNVFKDEIRNKEQADIDAYGMEEKQNIETSVQEEIKNAIKAREAYLSGLDSY